MTVAALPTSRRNERVSSLDFNRYSDDVLYSRTSDSEGLSHTLPAAALCEGSKALPPIEKPSNPNPNTHIRSGRSTIGDVPEHLPELPWLVDALGRMGKEAGSARDLSTWSVG